MNRYLVTITLEDGNKVEARIAAVSKNKALERLYSTPILADFAKDSKISKVDITPIAPADAVGADRFEMVEQGNLIRCFDHLYGGEYTFTRGEYNSTNKMVKPPHDKNMKAVDVATIARELGEWISVYHHELI